MEDLMIATQIENLDRRLARVEQILPTLATKEDLKLLATKEELKALATKEDLAELRRHMNVLNEAVRSDIQLLAEHGASSRSKPRKR